MFTISQGNLFFQFKPLTMKVTTPAAVVTFTIHVPVHLFTVLGGVFAMKSDDRDELVPTSNASSPDSHAMRRYTNRIVRLSLWIACIIVGILFLLGVNLGVLIPYLQVIVPLVFLIFLFTMKRPE